MQSVNPLLTPGRIGAVELRNRIVMPPMTTRLSDEEGHVTDATIAYYMARVRGGVGMITVEMASPSRAGRHRKRELGIYDDRFLPGLSRLVQEIHRGGAKASIQLGHGGGHTRVDICGETPLAPSAIPHPVFEVTNETIVPKEMTLDDIRATTAAFAAAAARAEQAGFDCVEIHAAHGYLISQFLTPFENRRTDQYGGSLENRARFGLDVLRAVKAAVKIPVIFRISVDDYFPEGLPEPDGIKVAVWAGEAGADALHIAAGHYRSLPSAARMIPPMEYPDATFLDYAAQVKRQVFSILNHAVPVIAVGRLGDPAAATDAVASGKADFVSLGRTLIADPEWVNKLARGEPIRRCLACNTCVNEMRGGTQLRCVVNGAAGRESEFIAAHPPQGERIAVIGAGPAGLTYASLVAAGNSVTVFERAARAGGAFRWAGKAPLFQEVRANPFSFTRYVDDMVALCTRRGVTFHYATDVAGTPDLLAPFDRVVIASGARYRFGLGGLATALLDAGAGHWPGLRQAFSNPAFRDWFYYRGRRPTGDALRPLARPGQKVVVIGDAAKAGKSRDAIASAFEAALLG
jgi:2,4-dienoyl-CoA reductase-like NADH-dependent reductase (Old Yellow Enzyme family)